MNDLNVVAGAIAKNHFKNYEYCGSNRKKWTIIAVLIPNYMLRPINSPLHSHFKTHDNFIAHTKATSTHTKIPAVECERSFENVSVL